MAVTKKSLNALSMLDANGNLVHRNFAEMDDAIASLQTATEQATTEVKGIVELATNEETATGSDSTRVVTPASLAHVLNPIKEKLENVVSGVTNFAYKDYTKEEHQGEMEVGVIYLVPFNKSNQFIKLDPSTNAPADDQDPGVSGDTEIAYYIKCIKDSDGSVVANDKVYTQGHLDNVAYLNKANTFTESNTFSAGILVTNGATIDTITATGASTFNNSLTVSGSLIASTGIDINTASGSTTVANAGQVKSYVDGYIPEARPQSQYETDLSGSGLKAGRMYLYYEE